LWAWLTIRPTTGVLPQISQCFAMIKVTLRVVPATKETPKYSRGAAALRPHRLYVFEQRTSWATPSSNSSRRGDVAIWRRRDWCREPVDWSRKWKL
jgi:hypothetical protein